MNLRTANISGATLRLSCVALACLPLSGPALAHEGHGMVGSHWHATDVVGLVVGVAVAALTWYSRDRE
mgnify:CR=1 FL=1|jgi:hypothetical protein